MGADTSEKGQILQVMRENGIDIGQIMISEFEQQLATKPDFPRRVREGGDAEFHCEVGYALAQGVLSSKLKPELYVWAKLTDRDDKIIWKSYQWVNQHLTGYKHDEYMQNPELLRQVLQQACAVVAKKFAKSL